LISPPIDREAEALGIFKNLSIRRTAACRFLLCGAATFILHFAAVEAHRRIKPHFVTRVTAGTGGVE
jgi:hypothetical protein